MFQSKKFVIITIISSIALTVGIICLAVFIHISWAKFHKENVIPILRQSWIVQRLFRDENYLKLIEITSENQFSTVWDATSGVALSKKIFTPAEMYGELKYRYKANTDIYNAVVWSGLFWQPLVFPATLETESLLSQLTAKYQIHFETDNYGFKQTGINYKDRQTIFFLGDSFTEGLWTEPQNTFVALVGKELPFAPVNMGVNGYGTPEMAWTLEHYGALLNPKVVVVNLFPNDVKADYFQVIQGNASTGEYQAMFKYLDRILEYCAKNDLVLIVSTIPAKEQFGNLRGSNDFTNKVAKWGEGKRVAIIDPYPYLAQNGGDSLYFTWDPHFNTEGHKIYAQFLISSITQYFRETLQ